MGEMIKITGPATQEVKRKGERGGTDFPQKEGNTSKKRKEETKETIRILKKPDLSLPLI